MRLVLPQDVHLVTDRLVVGEDALADQIPLLGLDPFVVVSHGAQRVGLGLVGHQVDVLAAVLEAAGLPLVERREAGAGVVAS